MMKSSFQWIVLAIAVCVNGTCWSDVTIERRNYRDWPDAVYMLNNEVEVVIVPRIGGRIMRYGRVGGPNLLWENKTASTRDAWPNWGGDKVWIWPQDQWKTIQGSDWPPPVGADQGEFSASLEDDVVTVTGPLVKGFGVRVERVIELSPAGSELTITNRLIQVTGTQGADLHLAAWTITQLPKPGLVMARAIESTLKAGYQLMDRHPWNGIETQDGLISIPLPEHVEHKIGLDADVLATRSANMTFVQRVVHVDGSRPKAGEQAQVYTEPDVPLRRDASTGAYVELELTGAAMPSADTPTLKVIWSISDETPSDAIRNLQ